MGGAGVRWDWRLFSNVATRLGLKGRLMILRIKLATLFAILGLLSGPAQAQDSPALPPAPPEKATESPAPSEPAPETPSATPAKETPQTTPAEPATASPEPAPAAPVELTHPAPADLLAALKEFMADRPGFDGSTVTAARFVPNADAPERLALSGQVAFGFQSRAIAHQMTVLMTAAYGDVPEGAKLPVVSVDALELKPVAADGILRGVQSLLKDRPGFENTQVTAAEYVVNDEGDVELRLTGRVSFAFQRNVISRACTDLLAAQYGDVATLGAAQAAPVAPPAAPPAVDAPEVDTPETDDSSAVLIPSASGIVRTAALARRIVAIQLTTAATFQEPEAATPATSEEPPADDASKPTPPKPPAPPKPPTPPPAPGTQPTTPTPGTPDAPVPPGVEPAAIVITGLPEPKTEGLEVVHPNATTYATELQAGLDGDDVPELDGCKVTGASFMVGPEGRDWLVVNGEFGFAFQRTAIENTLSETLFAQFGEQVAGPGQVPVATGAKMTQKLPAADPVLADLREHLKSGVFDGCEITAASYEAGQGTADLMRLEGKVGFSFQKAPLAQAVSTVFRQRYGKAITAVSPAPIPQTNDLEVELPAAAPAVVRMQSAIGMNPAWDGIQLSNGSYVEEDGQLYLDLAGSLSSEEMRTVAADLANKALQESFGKVFGTWPTPRVDDLAIVVPSSDDAARYFNRGVSLYLQRKYEDSKAALDRAVATNPYELSYRYWRVAAVLGSGSETDAKALLRPLTARRWKGSSDGFSTEYMQVLRSMERIQGPVRRRIVKMEREILVDLARSQR